MGSADMGTAISGATIDLLDMDTAGLMAMGLAFHLQRVWRQVLY
jgi:hypothetical protein